MRPLVIGSRGSALALRQTEIVAAALRAALPDLQIETRTMRTEGDRRQDVSLEAFGGQGVFVKDIELRLLDGTIDLAVHSLKDMPAETPAGLMIGAVLPRGDVRDALVGHGGYPLAELPPNARVGTDSRRRGVQLRALRADAEPVSVRGNVDTRVTKAESGELDAVILAYAGLERLGLEVRASQVFSIDEMLPAVGQGVLAVECRADDTAALETLAAIEDQDTRWAMTAERAYLRRLGAGCRLPVGAYATIAERMLRLRVFLADDADRIFRDDIFGSPWEADALGTLAAERVLSAADMLEAR